MFFPNQKILKRKKSGDFRNLDCIRKVMLLDPKSPWSIHRSKVFCLLVCCRLEITLNKSPNVKNGFLLNRNGQYLGTKC